MVNKVRPTTVRLDPTAKAVIQTHQILSGRTVDGTPIYSFTSALNDLLWQILKVANKQFLEVHSLVINLDDLDDDDRQAKLVATIGGNERDNLYNRFNPLAETLDKLED
ncbi:hypothetical protein [Candidatus Rariloculus sp.]|uniref:hypothetical protein n=1 Tax=Candidatus Rariloculus sp. TaxID=3101265 RepID=UPI003D0AAEE5